MNSATVTTAESFKANNMLADVVPIRWVVERLQHSNPSSR